MYARTLDHDDLRFSASTIMADLKKFLLINFTQSLSQHVPWFSRSFQRPPTSVVIIKPYHLSKRLWRELHPDSKVRAVTI